MVDYDPLHVHLLLVKKSPLRYHFLLVNKVRSLSLSIGEIWPTQLYSLSLKYDPPHFHFLWVKYGPDNYFYFHQRWNMICSIALSKVSTVPCRSYDVRAFWQCTAVQVPNFHCEGFVYIYQCWLRVVIDDSLGRVGHESQNLQMLFSEQVMVRKDHINLVIFNLVSPPLWKEELSHNKLMHKVQMYMSCFCSVLLTHIFTLLCYARRYSNWHQLLLLVSFGQIYFYQGFNGHNINSSWSPNKQRSNLVILFLMQKCRKDEDLLLLFKTEPGP